MTKKKIAIMGCGPGGMFFLHALALRKQKLEDEGNTAAIAALPEVTCFERSASAGGLWRADRKKTNGDDSGNMYEALWTNGPKESIEFFDYTFDEHFGTALPMYVPRQLILEYILARCTRNNPTFFDNVKFNTSVENVTYNEEMKKFVVNTVYQSVNEEEKKDGEGESSETIAESNLFDFCIWAAGENGRAIIPQSIGEILSSGGFKGQTMHSSESGVNFDQHVRGKNILIIGDSFSAEDLTLEACKLGVSEVSIISRSGNGICNDTGSWPEDKVDIFEEYTISKVTDDGFGVVLSNCELEREVTLKTIDTVIYCTGYTQNMDMLDPSLRPNLKGPYFQDYDIPKDWKMPKNSLTKEFGDIPIGKIAPGYQGMSEEDVYRGRLMSNPNMMFLSEDESESPLQELDVGAWLTLAHITGDLPLPTQEEMKQFNLTVLLDWLEDPIAREDTDENYKLRWREVDDDHWTENRHDKRMKQINKNYIDLIYRELARDMIESNYPLHIGTHEKLNAKGRALVEFLVVCDHARFDLDDESKDADWKTFRDCDVSKVYSIMTGTRTAPLKTKWLELEGHSVKDIVHISEITKKKKKTETSLMGRLKSKLKM